jgi:hypothetical protein
VSFNGSNAYFNYGPDGYEDLEDFTNGLTSFYVGNRNSTADSYARFFDLGNGQSADNIGLGRYNNTQSLVGNVFRGSSGDAMYSNDDILTANKEVLAGFMFEGSVASTTNGFLYRNGEVLGANQTTVNSPYVANRTQNYMGRSSWGNYFGGDIPEGIIYDWELSEQQRTMVNTYLAVKYGFALNTDYLSTDTTKVWDITKGGGLYNKGVFGLAHDSLTVLDQLFQPVLSIQL